MSRAELSRAQVLTDDARQVVMHAVTRLHADGSFRHRHDDSLDPASVMVALPKDVQMPGG